MAVIKSFTSFVEEKKKHAPKFELYGEVYTLPSALSYDAVLQLQALRQRGKEENVEENEVFDIFSTILGRDNVIKLRKQDDFSVDVATEMVQWALGVYGLTGGSDPKDQKA